MLCLSNYSHISKYLSVVGWQKYSFSEHFRTIFKPNHVCVVAAFHTVALL